MRYEHKLAPNQFKLTIKSIMNAADEHTRAQVLHIVKLHVMGKAGNVENYHLDYISRSLFLLSTEKA